VILGKVFNLIHKLYYGYQGAENKEHQHEKKGKLPEYVSVYDFHDIGY
jgi:hypothetical protein